jgi:hypothetical protein
LTNIGPGLLQPWEKVETKIRTLKVFACDWNSFRVQDCYST